MALSTQDSKDLLKEIGGSKDKLEAVNGAKFEEMSAVPIGVSESVKDSVTQAITPKLLPEDTEKLLTILRARFEDKEKPYKSAEGVKWEDIQKKLEDNPEKLWSLNEMERTGGEPDLVEIDTKTGEYIFMDCSAESPEDRRNCCYDGEGKKEIKERYPNERPSESTAVDMAKSMGVDLLNVAEYRELQTKGVFDNKSMNWLKTPVEKRKAGFVLLGLRVGNVVDVYEVRPYAHGDSRGWRAVLRVK